jgi:TonB-linked SusC/RagA family outer membrane protein
MLKKNKFKFLQAKRRLCLVVACAAGLQVAAQEVRVSGVVKDSDGAPVAGATVMVRASSKGVMTGEGGAYSIMATPTDVLEFSFVGLRSVSELVGDRTAIDVVLAEAATDLEDVVVVGYGAVRKSDVTGAVSRVSESAIKEKPVQNALQAIQGKAPGVDITSNLRPGEVGEIRIRGSRSITASNEPLYVVDGIPLITNSTLAGSIANPITDINPNDIASIEILKDASATAIYGSRGANGVILVTLKSGAKGRTSVDYDGSVTFSNIHSLTDWMSSGELLDWRRQSDLNGGNYNSAYGTAPDPARDLQLYMGGLNYMRRILGTAYQLEDNDPSRPVLRPATAEEQARGYAAQVPAYDASKLFDQHWADLILRTGVSHNHQVSLSAGAEHSRLYISAGYLDQQSPMKDQDYNRYTLNLKGDISPKKWFTAGLALNAAHSIQNLGMQNGTSNSGSNDSYGQAVDLYPYAPAYDEEGNLFHPTAVDLMSSDNVLNNIQNATYEVKQYSIMANAFAEVKLTPWLRYRMNAGSQYRNSRTGYYYGADFSNPFGSKPVASNPRSGYWIQPSYFSWIVENLLYADKTIGVHNFGVTLLQSAQKFTTETINVRSMNLSYPTAKWYALGENATSQPYGFGTGYNENQLVSYMGRLNYGLMDRYLLTLTGRWDGASVLAEGHKWDFFPSVALAWKMEQEEFIKSIDLISQLKLRVGYGVTGNSAVAPYTTSGAIRTENYYFGGSGNAVGQGVKANVMPNLELGWEKTAQWNIGLDFGMLRNRISGTLELYKANTGDLLLDRSILATTGYTQIRANIGKTENRGVEITISSVNIDAKNFRWTTDLSWSANREKIVELANGVNEDLTNGWFVGQPIRVWYDLKFERLWQDTPEDQRLMEIYQKISNYTYQPGQTKVEDQPMVVDNSKKGEEGWKTITLSSGEEITYEDNGFGVISTGTGNTDRKILGTSRPDWVAGLTNTFTYKNFDLSFSVYARVGSMYYGALQTYGRRQEASVWSPENTGAKFYQPTTKTGLTDHNATRNYTDGSLVAVRNISLSYTLPEKWLKQVDLRRVQVYGQVLNPFLWGGEAVQLGLNTDDVTDWRSASFGAGSATGGGTSNNTMLIRSWVVGLRVNF